MQSRLITRSFIASLDQTMLSALNFLVSILLIKTASKLEYGYYSIAFPISLFLISIQNAIVNTPLAVLLSAKDRTDKRQYLASLWYGQLITILPAALLGIVAAGLLYLLGIDTTKVSVVGAVSFASIGILLREFFRACFYAEETPLQVFKIDTLYVLFLLVLLYFDYLFFKISVDTVFILMGLSSLSSAMLFRRNRPWYFDQKSLKVSYHENWKYGRWALPGVFVTHIQTYSLVYLLGALLGSEAVAEVSAARLLLMPMVLFRIGWAKVAVPHGSKLREQGQLDKYFKEQIFACLIFALIVFFYTAILIGLSDFLQTILFTYKYSDSLGYILFYSVIFIIGFSVVNASCGLQVTKNFDILTKVNFFTMLVTLGCAYFFIKTHGIKGGLTALIIGEALLSGILWFYFTKIVFLEQVGRPASITKKVIIAKFTKG